MKTKLIIVLGIVLMIGIATAVSLGISKEVKLDKASKDKLESINSDPIERGNITCDNLNVILTGEETCSQKMWKGDYKLGEVKVDATKCKTYNETFDENLGMNITECIEWGALKDAKIISEITKAQEKKLKELVKVMKKREDKINKEIDDAGEIILVEE